MHAASCTCEVFVVGLRWGSCRASPFLHYLQVGEFYETMGTDAVVLMQWAGLNPMGAGNPPRAGCPAANIRRTLQCLVQEANLCVVSIECPTSVIAAWRIHWILV